MQISKYISQLQPIQEYNIPYTKFTMHILVLASNRIWIEVQYIYKMQ